MQLLPLRALLALALLLPAGACPQRPAGWPAHGAAAASAPAAGPRNVILIVVDGMSYANEVGASWYTHGPDDPTALSFHGWPARQRVATWDTTTWEAHAPPGSVLDPTALDARYGYDAQQGGLRPLLHPGEEGREDYFLTRPAPDAAGELKQAVQPSTDSASSATAMACGRKVPDGVIAQDGTAELESVGELLRRTSSGRAGYGVATTVPFNHATPAAFAAHELKRSSYIALADDMLRARPDVVLGGGHPAFYAKEEGSALKPYISAEQYAQLKASPDWEFVERTAGQEGGAHLLAAARRARESGKPLFGLFGGPDASLNHPRATGDPAAPFAMGEPENPDCWELAEAALTVLSDTQRFPDGFCLLVEQGDVDWANHAGDWAWSLGAMHDADECARRVVEWLAAGHAAASLDNTLVLLVADHSHYLRLGTDYPRERHALPAGSGERPARDKADPWWRRSLPGGTVVYSGPLYHSNELVTLYATGAQAQPGGPASLLAPHLGLAWGGGAGVEGALDNTAIYDVVRDWLRLDAAAPAVAPAPIP